MRDEDKTQEQLIGELKELRRDLVESRQENDSLREQLNEITDIYNATPVGLSYMDTDLRCRHKTICFNSMLFLFRLFPVFQRTGDGPEGFEP